MKNQLPLSSSVVVEFDSPTQERVSYLRNMALQNQKEFNPVPFNDVCEQSVLASLIQQNIFTLDNGEGSSSVIYLSSLSKVGLMYSYLQIINELSIESIPVSFEVIIELIGKSDNGRDLFRVFKLSKGLKYLNPEYIVAFKSLLDLVKQIPELSSYKIMGKHVIGVLQNLINGNGLINSDFEFLLGFLRSEAFRKYYSKISFNMSVAEFQYVTVALSCNSAIKSVNLFLLGIFNNPIDLRSRINNYVPSLRNTITTLNNYHWVQPDANIGSPYDLLKILESIYLDYKKGIPLAKYFLQDLSAGIDFGHDFTNSTLGKSLISKGYKIYEKTGYQNGVCWVEDLLKLGMPIFSTLSTLLLIVPPNGENPIYICLERSYSIEYPNNSVIENGVSFPDLDSQDYKEYCKKLKNIASKEFRDWVSKLIADQLELN